MIRGGALLTVFEGVERSTGERAAIQVPLPGGDGDPGTLPRPMRGKGIRSALLDPCGVRHGSAGKKCRTPRVLQPFLETNPEDRPGQGRYHGILRGPDLYRRDVGRASIIVHVD